MTTTISKGEQRLRNFGKWVVTPLFSLGSAIITTVAVASFSFISGMALPWFILLLLTVFLTEMGVSLYTFKNSVPDTLAEIFVHNIFKGLSSTKKLILGLGIFSALGGGLAIGSLTYLSSITAITALLSLLAISFPPLGIAIASLLALTGFIAVSSLFIKRIANGVKNELHKKIVPFFKEIFTRDHSLPLAQQVLEGFFKLLFTLGIIGVIVVGTISSLGTMQKSLSQLLTLIPNANTVAVKISSGIITYALFGVARLPLILQSVCEVFSQIGEFIGNLVFKAGAKLVTLAGVYEAPPLRISNMAASSTKLTLSHLIKTAAALIHAVSSAALARRGGGQVVSEVMRSLRFPLSGAELENAGQVSAAVSGGVVSLGLSAFTFFGNEKKQRNPVSKIQKSEIELTEIIANRAQARTTAAYATR